MSQESEQMILLLQELALLDSPKDDGAPKLTEKRRLEIRREMRQLAAQKAKSRKMSKMK